MKLVEYRIPMPLNVEEYEIGLLYSVAETSKQETGGGEGVEVLHNFPFKNIPVYGGRHSSGQYTYKIYHLSRKVPYWVRALAPAGAFRIHEESWNCFPYTKTVLHNPYMKENFYLEIETYHSNGLEHEDNILEISDADLKIRQICKIDISQNYSSDFSSSCDPTTFLSQTTNRGPLTEGWIEKADPVMVVFKAIRTNFQWFGLQEKIESLILKNQFRVLSHFHQQLYCWIDSWHGLTIQDIRRIEEETAAELEYQRKYGNIRGTLITDETA